MKVLDFHEDALEEADYVDLGDVLDGEGSEG
jgi:hypothetical protein